MPSEHPGATLDGFELQDDGCSAMILVTPETRQRLTTHHPEALREIQNLEGVLDASSLDPALLALCGEFFDASVREQDFNRSESLTPLEAACLDVCEQFTTAVSAMRDEQIAALCEHLSTDDVYQLMYAIYLIEMSRRLDITLERVLQ